MKKRMRQTFIGKAVAGDEPYYIKRAKELLEDL